LFTRTGDGDFAFGKTGLNAKCTSCSALARVAVADGYFDWLSLSRQGKLTAATFGFASLQRVFLYAGNCWLITHWLMRREFTSGLIEPDVMSLFLIALICSESGARPQELETAKAKDILIQSC